MDDGDVPVGWYVVDVLSMPMDEINCDFHGCLFGELNEDAQRRVLIITVLVVGARHIRRSERYVFMTIVPDGRLWRSALVRSVRQ